MKLSEVPLEIVARHCRTTPDDLTLPIYFDAGKAAVLSYTGLSKEAADERPELTVAALVLTADMYDNRQVQADNDKVNRVFESFVSLHDYNLLPGEESP